MILPRQHSALFDVRSSSGYAPMRVVAVMDEPIVYLGDMLHIDGLLAYAAYHELDIATRKTIAPIESTDWPVDIAQPLATWWCDPVSPPQDARLLKRAMRGSRGTAPQLWGWCASAADESCWAARGATEVRKRPAVDQMRRYATERTFNASSGHTKAYDLTLPTVLAREVVWYALGDVDRVRHLLTEHVPAIGKKRNIGNGTVREWRVEQIDHDWSILRDGKLTRRMPAGAVDDATQSSLTYAAIRPPYYHATRIVEAIEPC